jgi:hypothetical protein
VFASQHTLVKWEDNPVINRWIAGSAQRVTDLPELQHRHPQTWTMFYILTSVFRVALNYPSKTCLCPTRGLK